MRWVDIVEAKWLALAAGISLYAIMMGMWFEWNPLEMAAVLMLGGIAAALAVDLDRRK